MQTCQKTSLQFFLKYKVGVLQNTRIAKRQKDAKPVCSFVILQNFSFLIASILSCFTPLQFCGEIRAPPILFLQSPNNILLQQCKWALRSAGHAGKNTLFTVFTSCKPSNKSLVEHIAPHGQHSQRSKITPHNCPKYITEVMGFCDVPKYTHQWLGSINPMEQPHFIVIVMTKPCKLFFDQIPVN